ncbi:MAG: translesion error-prone DNA polymerase V autoproteolytic subunit [Neptuniibacter sp.]
MSVVLLAKHEVCSALKIPFYLSAVSAGFPSPAQDYVEKTLDLNELLISRPSATYFVRAEGDSMLGAGIHSGDILIVDRSLTAKHEDIVIAALQGELTVKQLMLHPVCQLLPRNPRYKPIVLKEESDLELFGVVTNVIHNFR